MKYIITSTQKKGYETIEKIGEMDRMENTHCIWYTCCTKERIGERKGMKKFGGGGTGKHG